MEQFNPPESDPQENKGEKSPEKFPTKEEIQSVFEQILKGREYKEVRILTDDIGVTVYEIEVALENGEKSEYSYQRTKYDSEAPGTVLQSSASIHVVDFDSTEMPLCGENVAEYRNGVWTFVGERNMRRISKP